MLHRVKRSDCWNCTDLMGGQLEGAVGRYVQVHGKDLPAIVLPQRFIILYADPVTRLEFRQAYKE